MTAGRAHLGGLADLSERGSTIGHCLIGLLEAVSFFTEKFSRLSQAVQ